MWPVRTAVSGKQNTPGGATEIMEVLGKAESVRKNQECNRIIKQIIYRYKSMHGDGFLFA